MWKGKLLVRVCGGKWRSGTCDCYGLRYAADAQQEFVLGGEAAEWGGGAPTLRSSRISNCGAF